MNIIFDHRPGEIFDFFRSLWFGNNYEFIKEHKKEYGIEESNAFEKSIEKLIKNSLINKEKLERYFHQELKPEYFTGMSELWDSLYLQKYLEHAKEFNVPDLIDKMEQIVGIICDTDSNDDKSEVQDLDSIIEYILETVTESDIAIALKWEIFLFLRDPKHYIEEVYILIKKFIPLYNNIEQNREEVLSSYNKELEEGINQKGLKYLEEEIDYSYDFSKFNEIKITTTALVSLQIYAKENICYVLIGPSIKQAMQNRKTENGMEKNLNFINGISETTRYKILQLLSKRKYYGQEIADTLEITKTTMFYHLNYLISIDAVRLEKDSQKNYYLLNKDALLENMKSFKNNLEL